MALLGQKQGLLALLAAAVVLAPSPALAFNFCPWGTCPKPKKEVFDDQTQMLIWEISHKPELMNLAYLQYFIGHPENEAIARGAERHYYWYKGPARELVYELIQVEDGPGRIVDSTMIVHMKGMGMDFDKLDKLYAANVKNAANGMNGMNDMNANGSPSSLNNPNSPNGLYSRRFFDYYGHPNELFVFAPNTSVSFSCPGNTFRIEQAKIIYRGAPLPTPGVDDLAMAESAMIARARSSHLVNMAKDNAKGKKKKQKDDVPTVQETAPMLMTRLQAQPFNAEAHLHLAQAYQKECRLNDAIGEYKLALALSGDNEDVRNQSLQALRNMNLLPAQTPEPLRNLEIVDHGQRMKVVGYDKDPSLNPVQDPNLNGATGKSNGP